MGRDCRHRGLGSSPAEQQPRGRRGDLGRLLGERLAPYGIKAARFIFQEIALPAVSYIRISGPRDHVHDLGASGLAMARIQVTRLRPVSAIAGKAFLSF